MKPFWAIDLTHDKKNATYNGSELLVEKPSFALEQALEDSTEKADATKRKAKLPKPLRIIQHTCGIIAALLISSLIRSLTEVTIDKAYGNAPWIFYIAGVTLVIWGILQLSSIIKSKSVLETEDSHRVFSRLDSVTGSVFADLDIPSTARDTDILSFYYKTKDGNIKPCTKGLQMALYLNPVFKTFADSENIYLASLDGKYAIPRSSLTAIKTVKKHTTIARWNKDNSLRKDMFKQYKLTTDNYGSIHSKYYHILEFTHNGEVWGIYIPCYELPVFEYLTGLKAQ